MYEYRATLVRVVDGDTVWLEVDLGFDIRRLDSFRLVGINAPEMNTAEGKAAREWLVARLPAVLMIRTVKDRREKYGRYLATLYVDGTNVNEQMIEEGHAQRYM